MSRAEFGRLLEDAAVASPGDTCVLVGGGLCECAEAINRKREREVRSAFERLDCQGQAVDCARVRNPHVEDGRCVADIEP